MRGKLLLVVGLAVGYVLGARAGRQRYETIKRVAGKLWGNPQVQKQVRHAEDFAKAKAPDVAEFLSASAKKVAAQVGGKSKRGAVSPDAASPDAASPDAAGPDDVSAVK